jgi:hypothetical protein
MTRRRRKHERIFAEDRYRTVYRSGIEAPRRLFGKPALAHHQTRQ